MKVTKRNGNVTIYDDDKIVTSILKANAEVPRGEDLSKAEAYNIAEECLNRLTAEEDIISTADVRACVYQLLLERNLPVTAQHYMEYIKTKRASV